MLVLDGMNRTAAWMPPRRELDQGPARMMLFLRRACGRVEHATVIRCAPIRASCIVISVQERFSYPDMTSSISSFLALPVFPPSLPFSSLALQYSSSLLALL